MIMVPLFINNRKSLAVQQKTNVVVENDVRGLFIIVVCIAYSLVLFSIAAAAHTAFIVVRTVVGAFTTESVITITVVTSKTIINKSKPLQGTSQRG